MKKLIILFMLLLIASLSAQVIGKIGLVTGSVKYKESQNAIYKDASRNMSVHKDGFLSLDFASTAEIIFNDLGKTEERGRKEISINEIYDKLKKPQTPMERLKSCLKNINTTSTQKPKTEAGIRREEQQVQKKETYYWADVILQKLDDAINLYNDGKITTASEAFEKVIEQDPLSRDAEIAHAYLIMIYGENSTNSLLREKHLSLLRQDFPQSEFLEGF